MNLKEKDIIFSNYDKILFIDESGDTGFTFNDDKNTSSSELYVTSCFITTPDNIPYNIELLNMAKHELNLDNKELKSTTLKRHRFADKAYEHFKDLKGYAFSFVAFKQSLYNNKSEILKSFATTEDKFLSGTLHGFPISALIHLQLINQSDKILIVFDRLTKDEQVCVENALNTKNWNTHNNATAIYRDSKSQKYQLIQIADMIAGTVRTYIESNMQNSFIKTTCKKCYYLNNYCNKHPTFKKQIAKINIENKYRYIFKLHSQPNKPQITAVHVYSLPPDYMDYFSFLTCKIIGFNTHKKRS